MSTETIIDARLQLLVQEALELEPQLTHPSAIGVSVNGGVVTLTGRVASYGEKLAAERAASRIVGVRGLAQEIDVRLPSQKKYLDDEIAQRALRVLSWDDRLPAEKIQVRVEDGWVTLSGSVNAYWQKESAEAAVQRLGGVREVENLLLVEPPARAGAVRAQIQNALARDASIHAANITIVLEGDRVHLGGNVPTLHERTLAVQAAWNVPGVRSVENAIQVG